uniref:Uncharacterized protein n=1 Tax=Meloidogyne hapla TaxID=6305 RepID=A0A1I8C3R9_MELHA
MELKKLNENQQNVTEIIIELSEEMKNKEFYISIFQDPCYETAWTNSYNTNNAVIGENGKKQMRIEREYTNYYKHGILICGLGDLLGTKDLEKYRKRQFFAYIEKGEKLLGQNNFINNFVINENHRRSELEGISHLEICLKFEHSGKYLIRIFSSEMWKEPKIEIHFHVKIKKENKIKCLNKMFNDYKNKDEIDLINQLREGIMILVLYSNHSDNEEYMKIVKVEDFDDNDYDIANLTDFKPIFDEDFKFIEEENIKKRKRND